MEDENMPKYHLCFIIFVLLFSGCIDKTTSPDNSDGRELLPPPEGVYHCAFPDFGAAEGNVTSERIVEFENLWINRLSGYIFPIIGLMESSFPKLLCVLFTNTALFLLLE